MSSSKFWVLVIIALIDLPIGYSVIVALTGLPIGYSVIVVLFTNRFYYEKPGLFTPDQLREIKKTSLAKVICNNADNITTIPSDVFVHQPVHQFVSCDELDTPDLFYWMDCQGQFMMSLGVIMTMQKWAIAGTCIDSVITVNGKSQPITCGCYLSLPSV